MRGQQFGANGQLEPFIFGPIQSGVLQAGGTVVDTGRDFSLLARTEYYSGFGRLSYDFDNGINTYVEVTVGNSYGENHSSLYLRNGNTANGVNARINIAPDNVYLSDAVRSGAGCATVVGTPTTAPAPCFTMGRTNLDLLVQGDRFHIATTDRDFRRFVWGAGGELPLNGSWNTYYQYGQTDLFASRKNNPLIANYNLAVDAVANPAVGGVAGVAVGAPVCRSTLTNPNNGCQPMNIFGVGNMTRESLLYIMGVTQGAVPFQDTVMKQSVAAVDGQIEPFSTWAGPVALVAGLEYRKEAYNNKVDTLSLTNAWWSGNFKPSSGEYNVKEVFTEAVVPLLKDRPFAESTDLNLAFRHTDYSVSGEVDTWKVGLTHEFNPSVRLRAARSRDIRAPNLADLFLAGATNTPAPVIDPTTGTAVALNTTTSGGNPNLQPEIADTTTFGVVYRPSWAPSLSLSVDYYDISIEDAIVSLGTQQIINLCYGYGVPQNTAACNNIIYRTPGTVAGADILTGGVNASQTQITGIDYEASMRDINFLSGSLDIRLLVSQALKNEQVLLGQMTDFKGTFSGGTSGGPDLRGNLTLGYRTGPSRTTLGIRYLGSGHVSNYPNSDPRSQDHNDVPSTTYFNIAQNYDFEVGAARLTLYGSIENLFNEDPPLVLDTSGTSVTASGASNWHDQLGRFYGIGLRANF